MTRIQWLVLYSYKQNAVVYQEDLIKSPIDIEPVSPEKIFDHLKFHESCLMFDFCYHFSLNFFLFACRSMKHKHIEILKTFKGFVQG